jgi:phytoene synthase
VVNAALIDHLAPAERLALSYAPARARSANLALLALDGRLAAIIRSRLEPIAAQLRLAWWRDMLARPPAEWPRGEPVLDALRAWRDPAPLAALADGWEALLAEALGEAEIDAFVEARADAFACLARELDVVHARAGAADCARLWALTDLAAHVADEGERRLLLARAARLPAPGPLPAELRPLAVLARLGAASLARGGGPLLAGPRSLFLALRTGLTGR